MTKHGTEALTKPRGPWGRGRGSQRTTAAGHAWASATHPSCFLLWIQGDPRAPGSSRSVPAGVWGQPPASLGVGSGGGALLEREETERERRNSRDGESACPSGSAAQKPSHRSQQLRPGVSGALNPPARRQSTTHGVSLAASRSTYPGHPPPPGCLPKPPGSPPSGGPRPLLPQLRHPTRPKRAHPAH